MGHLMFLDKTVHAAIYVALVLYWHRRFPQKIYLVAFLTLFGFMIETLQHFTPSRTFSLADILANMVGIMAGIILVRVYDRHFSRKKESS
jgi:VanZ family protein